MSIKAVAAAIEVEGLAPATKLVLILLANRYNGDTGLCCPKQETIAAEACMTSRSLRTHLKDLETAGIICRAIVKKGHGQPDQTHYSFPFLDRKIFPPEDLDRKKSTLRPENSGDLDRKLFSGPIEQPEVNRKEPVPAKADPVSEAFDKIWAAWSKAGIKRSKSKAHCLDCLKRVGKSHDLKAIVRAATMYAKTTEGNYHKGLHTWLAGGFYENWMPRDMGADQAAPVDPLEFCFETFAKSGEWYGDRHGHTLPPNSPLSDYPPVLYEKFGLAQPERKAA
jgi:hypothetical protein